jgi:hypothetical protein
VNAVSHVELREDAVDMRFHRRRSQVQVSADLGVRQTPGDREEDVELARRETVEGFGPAAASGRDSPTPCVSHGVGARARLDRIGVVRQRLQFARDSALAHAQRRSDVPYGVHRVYLEKRANRLSLNGAVDPLPRGRVGCGVGDGPSDLLSIGSDRELRAERIG